MRAVAVIFAYFAFAGHGRRMRTESQNPVNSLASLLLKLNQEAGFKPPGPGLRLPQGVGIASGAHTRAQHPCAAQLSSLSSFFDDKLDEEDEMILPEEALEGRDAKMDVPAEHFVLRNPMQEVPDGYKVAVFANGCFWGSEKGIWRLPGDGIYSTAVGYCAGFTPNPTYEECCTGLTGHTEGVRVVYDPSKIAFVDILRWFWEAHDPTSGMGQGNDRGTQYRSGFYYFDDEQKALIEASKAAYEEALRKGAKGSGDKITTEIAAAADYDKYGGLWNYAEPYHQQYLAKPGARPYCSAKPQVVSLPPFEEWAPPGMEHHAPKLPEAFWEQNAPGKGCKVVFAPNEPIEFKF